MDADLCPDSPQLHQPDPKERCELNSEEKNVDSAESAEMNENSEEKVGDSPKRTRIEEDSEEKIENSAKRTKREDFQSSNDDPEMKEILEEKVGDSSKRTRMEDDPEEKNENSIKRTKREEHESSNVDSESSVVEASSEQSHFPEEQTPIVTTEVSNSIPDSSQAVAAGQTEPGLVEDVISEESSVVEAASDQPRSPKKQTPVIMKEPAILIPESPRAVTAGQMESVLVKDVISDGTSETANKEHSLHDHYKISVNMKMKRSSEFGRTVAPLEIDDSLKRWEELKRNGFISSSLVPKQRSEQHGCKSKNILIKENKNNVIKERFELAKREQIYKFRSAANSSGLLSGLNPGIINHVRNRKQVHSVIEAAVKSGHNGMTMAMIQVKREICEMKKRNDLEGKKEGCVATDVTHSQLCGVTFSASRFLSNENNGMPRHSLINLNLVNQTVVPSLAIKAGIISSQWLELLYKDTKRRLNALRRSKKRVRKIIRTELPLLLLTHSTPNEEGEPHPNQSSDPAYESITISDLRRQPRNAPFFKMESELCEEEKKLTCFFHQVKVMKIHLEGSLQWFKQKEVLSDGSGYRLTEEEIQQYALGLWAAAAAIYSTGRFAMGRSVSAFRP